MLKSLWKIFVIVSVLCAFAICAQAAQMLEDGAAGETVMVLTRRLVELGFMHESVDEYDERVESAVADFQTANGLARTGIADVTTQQAMNASDVITRSEYINSFAVQYDGISIAAGSNGDEVSRMQQRLMELGYYDFYVDGKYGEGTRRAVADYQRANGLESTGIADESFFIRLYWGESVSYGEFVMHQCAEKGDSGTNVHAIQKRLSELGYFGGEITGNYGDNTSRAVTHFQYDNGIEQSGNVDFETYEALFSVYAEPSEDDGSLYPGDSGDDVRAMQHQLSLMGFYRHEPDGVYDFCTETAVMLFRAANSLPITENADLNMLAVLYSGNAADSSALAGDGELTKDDIDAVCNYVLSCAGDNYSDSGEAYPGLGFVRNVFAGIGVDIGEPEDAVMNIADFNQVAVDIAPGDPLVMARIRNGVLVVNFAVCVGSGNIAWVNDITGIVEIVPMESIDIAGIYAWKVGR